MLVMFYRPARGLLRIYTSELPPETRHPSGLVINRRVTYRANEDERIALLSRNERRIGTDAEYFDG